MIFFAHHLTTVMKKPRTQFDCVAKNTSTQFRNTDFLIKLQNFRIIDSVWRFSRKIFFSYVQLANGYNTHDYRRQ